MGKITTTTTTTTKVVKQSTYLFLSIYFVSYDAGQGPSSLHVVKVLYQSMEKTTTKQNDKCRAGVKPSQTFSRIFAVAN